MKIQRFEDLDAWQEARLLAGSVYRTTNHTSFQGNQDLRRQMRRAATSVMANIAEGFTRYSFKDSKNFFVTARSSVAELRSHVYLAVDQSYVSGVDATALQNKLDVVGRLISGLIRNSQNQLAARAALKNPSEPLSH